MALKSKATNKIIYSMGEVCEMFDLPASTIRFWEKNFSQIKPKKNAKGNRLFSPEDVETLKTIYHLVKEKGMTLQGANQYLKDNKSGAKSEANMVEILQRVRSALVEIRTEINSYEKKELGEIIIKNDPVGEKFKEDLGIIPPSDLPTEALEEALPPDEAPKPRYYEPTLFDF